MTKWLRAFEFKFWWLSHWSVGLNPGCDTVSKMLYIFASLHPYCEGTVEVDIVFEKAIERHGILGLYTTPLNDQGTNN